MPETCGSCRGQGQVRFSQGFLTVARPCPDLPRPGTDQPVPVQGLRGRRAPEQGAAAQGDDPRRRGGRQSAPPLRRGRGRRARRPAGRPLRRHPRPRPRDLRPRRRRICSASCRSPFRRRPSATPSRCPSSKGKARADDPAGHTARPAPRPEGQGHAPSARAGPRRRCTTRSSSRCRLGCPRASGSCSRSSSGCPRTRRARGCRSSSSG